MPEYTEKQIDAIAQRAAELAIGQGDRLMEYAKNHPPEEAVRFYALTSEMAVSDQIARLMRTYAHQKGFLEVEPIEIPI